MDYRVVECMSASSAPAPFTPEHRLYSQRLMLPNRRLYVLLGIAQRDMWRPRSSPLEARGAAGSFNGMSSQAIIPFSEPW
mmetsp:Transcript_49284/g.122467  ORF Transcript_49284/g.122467 Transcript_49284/m.122467 type:complete len:80 (+) Transcript_49284:1038-1277(+)